MLSIGFSYVNQVTIPVLKVSNIVIIIIRSPDNPTLSKTLKRPDLKSLKSRTLITTLF